MEANRIGFTALDQRISGVVRALLAVEQVDQKVVADAIGMHANVFGRKCRGESAFSNGELHAVATFFNLSASDLVRQAELGGLGAPRVISPSQAEKVTA